MQHGSSNCAAHKYMFSVRRGLEFADLTGFPSEQLLADPDNVTYDKLQLKNTGVCCFGAR